MKRERKPVVTFTSAGATRARCPSCGSGLRIESKEMPNFDGRKATCPRCGHKYVRVNPDGELRLIIDE